MKVSLLITNYNYDKWLRRCLRSCLNQDFNDYEIIIVDDYSTDNSRNILLDYKDNPKINIIFNNENLGIGSSCLVGAKKARGKYIVRVDSDDYVHESFIKCLWLYASFNNSTAVACDYQVVDIKENVIERHSQDKEPIGCGIMFRTDILELIGSYQSGTKINEDKEILSQFRTHGFELDYLHIPLYRYFKHSNSLSSK